MGEPLSSELQELDFRLIDATKRVKGTVPDPVYDHLVTIRNAFSEIVQQIQGERYQQWLREIAADRTSHPPELTGPDAYSPLRARRREQRGYG